MAAGRERIRCAVTITAWGGDDPRYPASLRIEDQAGFEATVDVVRFEPVAGGGADGAGG